MGWSKEYNEDNYDIDTRCHCSICNKKKSQLKHYFFFGMVCTNCLIELRDTIRSLAKEYEWIKD